MAADVRMIQRHRYPLSTIVVLFALTLLLSGCLRQGVYHRVEPGQTLYRISKTYGVDEAYLARINGIPNPTQLRVGTRIFIPGAIRAKPVPATSPGYLSGNKKASARSHPLRKVPASKAPLVKTRLKSATKRVFQPPILRHKQRYKARIHLKWPLRGKILRAFGESRKGGGKGVEIAARVGSKVRAAAAGKVIYSGDGVQGFGHLMILQHENDVFTVYGFNQRNYVKQGQFVSQSQIIASSGRPSSDATGRLHFEVRVGKVAVNPVLYLP